MAIYIHDDNLKSQKGQFKFVIAKKFPSINCCRSKICHVLDFRFVIPSQNVIRKKMQNKSIKYYQTSKNKNKVLLQLEWFFKYIVIICDCIFLKFGKPCLIILWSTNSQISTEIGQSWVCRYPRTHNFDNYIASQQIWVTGAKSGYQQKPLYHFLITNLT